MCMVLCGAFCEDEVAWQQTVGALSSWKVQRVQHQQRAKSPSLAAPPLLMCPTGSKCAGSGATHPGLRRQRRACWASACTLRRHRGRGPQGGRTLLWQLRWTRPGALHPLQKVMYPQGTMMVLQRVYVHAHASHTSPFPAVRLLPCAALVGACMALRHRAFIENMISPSSQQACVMPLPCPAVQAVTHLSSDAAGY